MNKECFLTGASQSGILHLGHYFGALSQAINFANTFDSENYFVIANIHALTTNFQPDKTTLVGANVLDLVAQCVAFGMDPNKFNFYLQSEIPESFEIFTIIQNLIPLKRLMGIPSLEEKQRQTGHSLNVGLINYPVLEATDIISMQANQVSVGPGNFEHFEICHEIIKILSDGWRIDLVKPQLYQQGVILRGTDGNEKMSKSLNNTITLLDDRESIINKIKAMPEKNNEGISIRNHFASVVFGSQFDKEINYSTDDLINKLLNFMDEKWKTYSSIKNDKLMLRELLIKGTLNARTRIKATRKRIINGIGYPTFLEDHCKDPNG